MTATDILKTRKDDLTMKNLNEICKELETKKGTHAFVSKNVWGQEEFINLDHFQSKKDIFFHAYNTVGKDQALKELSFFKVEIGRLYRDVEISKVISLLNEIENELNKNN